MTKTDAPAETDAPETVGKTAEQPATGTDEPAEEVAKADGDSEGEDEGEKAPQLAVYDAKGKLVGIVDPSALTPVTGVDGDDDEDDSDGSDSGSDSGDAAPPAAHQPPAAAPQTPDLAPAPAAEVGTPSGAVHSGDDVTKQTDTTEPATADDQNDTTTSDVLLKSSITEAVRAGIADYSATQEQTIAKQAAELAQMADVVEALKGRIETLEEQPATPKVFTQGAVPPRDMMRGQDRGATPVDVARAQEMKKGLYGAADASEQNRIATDMQELAIAQLREIHQQRG